MNIKIVKLNRIQRDSILGIEHSPFKLDPGSELEKEKSGELVTATVVAILAIGALKTLAIWLSKTTTKGTVKRTVKIEKPTGEIITIDLVVNLDSSQSAEAQVIEQINKALTEHGIPNL